MPTPASIADVIAALDARYPPRLAADWDAIGLVCGSLEARVGTVLFAVDPATTVVKEAIDLGVDLIVAHHPLFLRGVHSVAAATPGGGVVHELISHGIGLLTAHTNADCAENGVSDSLAAALGLERVRPLVPDPFDGRIGFGRVGDLDEPMSLARFAARVATALPPTAQGVRVAGDPEAMVRTVAVCGGSGDEFLPAAADVADAYVTSDLRHHRALDHAAAGGCALVDVAHWAGEWPWLAVAAGLLVEDLAVRGITVGVHVSTIATDPWEMQLGSDGRVGSS